MERMMEALYSKLYSKYTKLKTEKFSELELLNKDQEVKFINYVSAAEELIEHLKNENERLRAQVNDMRSEVASIRSTKDEQYVQYEKLLLDENQKNKELSKEIERLQNLQREGLCCSSKDDKNENGQLNMHGGAQVGSVDASNGSPKKTTKKRGRDAGAEAEEGIVTPCTTGQVDHFMVRESAKNFSKDTMFGGALVNFQKPECCRRTIRGSGGGNDSGLTSCLFQGLVECLVGMKLSIDDQTEGICISALHQSSGYSFSLTWINKAAGEEAELMYRVLSLGTFEIVAPEWMREVLLFSKSMCPVFFERISRVIKLHH
ncbi:hypothetical protein L1049_018483 [Liquidambar formosana]|uniref:DUF7806 domain-containing protein n=1 Tax=Liquidambar formosana TaxID=63359 RepID=A0AAP0RAV7_LIQFO